MHIARDAALATLALSFFVFSACQTGQSHANAVQPGDPDPPTAYTLTYNVDRTAVPDFLYYNDLTLLVQVNDAQTINVTADGAPISYTRDMDSGQILLTTDAAQVEVQLAGVGDPYGVGSLQKAALRDNKGFAWSHGMDDNVYLRAQVGVLEKYGWRGTFFLIAEKVDDVREEDWIADAPYIQRKLADGWSIGNHDWDHNCTEPIDPQKLLDAYQRLSNVVAGSAVPSYKITAFAAPCFLEAYHPVVLAQRDAGDTSILFNESGNATPLLIDAGASAPLTGENEFDVLASLFDFDTPIGRSTDLSINVQGAIDSVDWMAARHAETGEHFWYNTLAHGNEEVALETLASHIYNEYGPNGTAEVWVAPSDEIYSYLLTRERSIISATADPPVPTLARVQLPLVMRSQ